MHWGIFHVNHALELFFLHQLVLAAYFLLVHVLKRLKQPANMQTAKQHPLHQ